MGLNVYIKSNVFEKGITHNMGKMAKEAGLYQILWRPEEDGITHAQDMIVHLEKGLAFLEADPEKYKEFNPANGWGSYEGLVEFVKLYLEACRQNPYGEIVANR